VIEMNRDTRDTQGTPPEINRRQVLALSGMAAAGIPVSLAAIAGCVGNPVCRQMTDINKNGEGVQMLVNVRDFGAVGDGVTDDHKAIQRSFQEGLTESGGIVFFPPGRYRCGGRIVSEAKPVSVLGAGRGSSVICFTATEEDQVGFLFDQQVYTNTVELRSLTLTTDQAEPGDALTVRYSSQDCRAVRIYERVYLENINIVGTDTACHGFRNGVCLEHVNSPLLLNVSVSGRQPAAGLSNRTHTNACFKLIGGALQTGGIPVQSGFYRCSGYNARFGIHVSGAHEGMIVHGGNFVECGVGIFQNSSSEPSPFDSGEPSMDGGTRPGIWISDTHCNVFQAGVYLQNVLQGIISNMLIYKAPDSSEDCAGVRLSRCSDLKMHHSIFVSQSRKGSFVGLLTENGTVRCQISDNTFEWCNESIHLGMGTSGCHVWDNQVQGGGSGVCVDEGERNRFRALGVDSWGSV